MSAWMYSMMWPMWNLPFAYGKAVVTKSLRWGIAGFSPGEPGMLVGRRTLHGMATPEQLMAALAAVTDPNTGRDFVTTRQVRNLQVNDGEVSFDVELGYPAKSQVPQIRSSLIAAAKSVAGVENVSVN